jgi:proteasome lid subunit RPN8/RPN11
MILAITAAQLEDILARARAAWPAEACGLLVGRGRRVLKVARVVPAVNLLADLPGRFELDPAVRLAVEKECRISGERVLGHWHSHPDGRAAPSATDLAMAYEPDLAWLIVGVDAGGAAQAEAFRPDAQSGGFRAVALRVGENSACITKGIPT